jgi:hypothetical protein
MERGDLQAMLASWQHLGPFRSVEEYYGEMRTQAQIIGSDAAPLLAATLIDMERHNDLLLDTLLEFLDFYSGFYPEALAQALLQHTQSDGPAVLVEVLGGTGNDQVVSHLRATLDLAQADESLLIALASTLGEIGDEAAVGWLHELALQSDLADDVRYEIAIALEFLEREA